MYSEVDKWENRNANDDDDFNDMKTPLERFDHIPPNTLDQGICDTLFRELQSMCYKFSYVLLPRQSQESTSKLRNWDLWGPFFICLVFGLFINNSQQFIILFFSVFGGALIVTFNTQVLGGRISFLQSVAILGYCIFPIFLAALILEILKFFRINSTLGRLIAISIGVIWSILSARIFIAVNVPSQRKFVALYPVCLFYIFLGVLLIYM